MKRIILLCVMIQTISVTVYAQTTTYGTFAGTLGNRSSYFGMFAGQNASAASTDNSFFGAYSGNLSQGVYNSGFGTHSLYLNSSGSGNTGIGHQSLYSNTTASYNTALGYLSLRSNVTGSGNTAVGAFALDINVDGKDNTATGNLALAANSASNNTANGNRALFSNKTGDFNTATGSYALQYNTTGIWNTANGGSALGSNVTGTQNTATGISAAFANTRGYSNTANGANALHDNQIGNYNSAFGMSAGANVRDLDNTTSLGYLASPTASNSVRIGNTSVTSIGGQVMWTTLSDARFKRNIKEDITGLDFVNLLRPVSYEVDKSALNKFLNIPDSLTQNLAKQAPVRETGFIAQEVEAVMKKTGFVFNGVEVPQNENDHYSLRYAAFVVPLVKAVQELTAKLNGQQLEITALKEKLDSTAEDKIGNFNPTKGVQLYQNTPNPFTLDTEIKMALPETTRQASVIVYNMEGKELKSFQINERGNAAIKISGNDLSAGMYLYALIVDGKVADTKRLILTR